MKSNGFMNISSSSSFFPFILCCLLFFILSVDASFYFSPAAKYYEDDKAVPTKTVKLTSIPRAIPFGFYTFFGHELPFCKPDPVGGSFDLGQCLSGDWIQNSAYQIHANKNHLCQDLCADKKEVKYDDQSYEDLRELIKWDYRAQMMLDDLPVAINTTNAKGHSHFDVGFPIGFKNETGIFLYNHLAFKIGYNTVDQGSYITSVLVIPYSIDFELEKHECTDDHDVVNIEHQALNITGLTAADKKKIIWSYSVTWEKDTKTEFDKRWNQYFQPNTDLHIVSMTYAVIVAVALTLFLGIVLIRIIRTPVSKFNFDDVEESGWKTLHGDVFRPPRHFMMLSVMVGGGAQLLATALVILLLGFVGYLSPARSGSMNVAIVVVYPLLGFVSGYTSARVYTRLGGARKRRNALLSAVGFNGILFLLYFLADIVLWSNDSSAGRVGNFFSLIALWLFVHAPLAFLGAFFAHRRPVGGNPTGTNTIPRMVPPAPWYSHTYLLAPLLAILPFGISFNELYDLMDSLWSHHIYYFFGYALAVFILLTIIIAEVSVVLCYFQLANENYHWWWRAFYIPAIVVVYIFLTAMFYVGMDLHLTTFSSVFLYLCYTAIMLLVFFVFMSAISFYACWTFVHKIYSTLHVD